MVAFLGWRLRRSDHYDNAGLHLRRVPMTITVSERWQQHGIKYRNVDTETPLSVAIGQTIALNQLHPTLMFRLISD